MLKKFKKKFQERYMSLFFPWVAIDCEWSEWSIGNCSAECGTGTRINTRVKLVEESNGGTCTGKDEETLQCNVKECLGR